MNLRTLFFDYNLDHILEALGTQAIFCVLLWLLHLYSGPEVMIVAGGAAAAIGRFYGREQAQYEYHLEQTAGYDPHDARALAFWLALLPWRWQQRWDFYAPTIAVLATVAIARFA